MSLDFMLYANRRVSVLDENITHNLGRMAKAAGIYDCLWRPNENGFDIAHQIIPILEKGLSELKKNPEKFKEYNAPNGWGLYEHFVPYVQRILDGCYANPDAEIVVSR